MQSTICTYIRKLAFRENGKQNFQEYMKLKIQMLLSLMFHTETGSFRNVAVLVFPVCEM